jgi:hypothetical protein
VDQVVLNELAWFGQASARIRASRGSQDAMPRNFRWQLAED